MEQDNVSIYEGLSKQVAGQFLQVSGGRGELRYGPLEINDFSVCFCVDDCFSSKKQGIYVKIPKVDLRLNGNNIFPLSDKDKEFAEKEYRSLCYLARHWGSEDLHVSFVKPLGFLREYNAIVTQKIYAQDIYKEFRWRDLIGKCGIRRPSRSMHDLVVRFGTALARFHASTKERSVFQPNGLVSKVVKYCGTLKTTKTCNSVIEQITFAVNKLANYSVSSFKVATLKGLDLRNILIDRSRRVYLLDPGAMKVDNREADLARFIVTMRLLYWGCPWFFLRLSAATSFEQDFLRGYVKQDKDGIDEKILSAYILKELIKHWDMAHTVLKLKPWPQPLKYSLRHAYINGFYAGQIKAQIAAIEL